SLLLGRATLAIGDLVTAKVALTRARALLSDDARMAAAVDVELAEHAYLKGDHEAAVREAERALASSVANAEHLSARNIVGKVLLAQSKWDEADVHFAEDVVSASMSGNATAELRARLNRGIALLWKGHHDEARSLFQSVHDDGERHGEIRACAFAQ